MAHEKPGFWKLYLIHHYLWGDAGDKSKGNLVGGSLLILLPTTTIGTLKYPTYQDYTPPSPVFTSLRVCSSWPPCPSVWPALRRRTGPPRKKLEEGGSI